MPGSPIELVDIHCLRARTIEKCGPIEPQLTKHRSCEADAKQDCVEFRIVRYRWRSSCSNLCKRCGDEGLHSSLNESPLQHIVELVDVSVETFDVGHGNE